MALHASVPCAAVSSPSHRAAMLPSHAAKALSATRSMSSKQKCVPHGHRNLKPTARRASSRSASMPWRSVSSCGICAPMRRRPHPSNGGPGREGSGPRSPGTRGANSRRARGRGSCRSRTLARRAVRPDRHSRLDDRCSDIAVSFPRALARPDLRNRDLFLRSFADGRGGVRLLVGLEVDASPGDQAMIEVGLAGQIVIGLTAGLVVGAFHFSSLWWNTQFFTTGAAGKAIALQLARIAVAVVVLTLPARLLGLAALLCGALGFLVARPLLLWRFGRSR